MSVRAAVFGTSRSGKDYTIRDATEILSGRGMFFTHISPISLVHEELNGRYLRDMPDCEKKHIINSVRKRMDFLLEDDYVFSDEHYCFPRTFGGRRIDNGYYGEKLPYIIERGTNGRLYEVVFDEEWIRKYDLAIYMEIDPHIIQERFRSSEGDKKNNYATYEDIRYWQIYEIKKIREICDRYEKPLYYVYNPSHSGEEIEVIISQFLKYRQQEQKDTSQ